MSLGDRLVYFYRPHRVFLGFAEGLLGPQPPRIAQDDEAIGYPRVREGEFGVKPHGLFKIRDGLLGPFLRPFVPPVPPLEIEGVGLAARSRLLLDLSVLMREDLHLQRVRDLLCDVALDGEDVVQLPVVTLGPDVGLTPDVDELHVDSKPLSRLANGPFKDRPDPLFPTDILDPLLL